MTVNREDSGLVEAVARALGGPMMMRCDGCDGCVWTRCTSCPQPGQSCACAGVPGADPELARIAIAAVRKWDAERAAQGAPRRVTFVIDNPDGRFIPDEPRHVETPVGEARRCGRSVKSLVPYSEPHVCIHGIGHGGWHRCDCGAEFSQTAINGGGEHERPR